MVIRSFPRRGSLLKQANTMSSIVSLCQLVSS